MKFKKLAILTVMLLIMFILGSQAALAVVFTSTDVPKTIQDSPGAEVAGPPATSVLTVAGAGVVADLNISLNISHTFMGDLVIQLTSPGGTTISVLNRPNNGGGGCSGNNMSVTLDDEAAGGNVNQICTTGASAYVAGSTLIPANALSAFDGEDPNGTWTLTIVDYFVGDMGTLNSWSLDVTLGTAPTITSPATAAGAVGTAFTHTFTAVGNPTPTLSYANENLPPGVTRAGDTLSGTPTAAGTYTIDATATNGVAPDATQKLIIKVTSPSSSSPSSQPAAPTPPPVPICNLIGNQASTVVRTRVVDGTVINGTVFCRVIAENGTFAGTSSEIGSADLIARGVSQAVDLFGLTAAGDSAVHFNSPVYVCLRGTGRLFYADASNSPRVYVEIPGSEQDGFTCGTIPNAGTVVLAGGS